MREIGMTGLKSPAIFSAVSTAMTPGAAWAPVVSIRKTLACDCSLRRNATCSARSGLRSALYSPLPVRSLGSSVRLIGAPTCRGRRTSLDRAKLSLLIAGLDLAQRLPLLIVVTANDGRAGFLDPPHRLERLQKCLGVPGIAGCGIRIEAVAQAYRVGRKQELTVTIETYQRA